MPFGGGSQVIRTPASQTAIGSATPVMNGLGAIASVPCALTLSASSRVLVMITGQMSADATARNCTAQLSYGTGTAPANAGALAGTQVGGNLAWTSLTGLVTVPFTMYRVIAGLSVGSAYWFDLAASASAGTVQFTNMNFTAIEI